MAFYLSMLLATLSAAPTGAPAQTAVAATDLFEQVCAMNVMLTNKADRAEWRTRLSRLRRDLRDYTRTHQGADLNFQQWAQPMTYAYTMSLYFDWPTFSEAHTGAWQGIRLALDAPTDDRRAAIKAAVEIACFFSSRWFQRRPEEAARLLDEMEGVVREANQSALETYWRCSAAFEQANVLRGTGHLPQERAEPLIASREARLREWTNDAKLDLRLRSRWISHWSRCLYEIGHCRESEALLDGWQTRQGTNAPLTPDYALAQIQQCLFVQGDHAEAKAILDRITARRFAFKQPSDHNLYRRVAEVYYAQLVLPEYELKRLGYIQRASNITERRVSAPSDSHSTVTSASPVRGPEDT